MKPIILIPPAAALVIAGSLLATQHHSISVLEGESALLRKSIAAAREASVSEGGAKPGKPAAAKKDKEPIDWKKAAAQMVEMRRGGGMGDMRTMIRLQQRLQSMTPQDLVSALDEIATLDLPADSRAMLEQMLVGPLVEKDPEMALRHFSDRLQDNRTGMAWQLSNALGKWAAKDPVKATAWFDQQIAAGNFDSKALDGRNSTRTQFEGKLLGTLFSSDQGAAAGRLNALPEDQRADVVRNVPFNEIKEENQKDYANLIRSQVTGDERTQLISNGGEVLVSKGYPEVTAYLDRISATPEERSATVEAAATSKIRQAGYQKTITREDLDAMRDWVGTQSPQRVDSTTGKALADATQGGGNLKYEDASALALQYHESSGNDDVLYSFLSGWQARQHKEESIKLAGKISDEKRREEILSKLK